MQFYSTLLCCPTLIFGSSYSCQRSQYPCLVVATTPLFKTVMRPKKWGPKWLALVVLNEGRRCAKRRALCRPSSATTSGLSSSGLGLVFLDCELCCSHAFSSICHQSTYLEGDAIYRRGSGKHPMRTAPGVVHYMHSATQQHRSSSSISKPCPPGLLTLSWILEPMTSKLGGVPDCTAVILRSAFDARTARPPDVHAHAHATT